MNIGTLNVKLTADTSGLVQAGLALRRLETQALVSNRAIQKAQNFGRGGSGGGFNFDKPFNPTWTSGAEGAARVIDKINTKLPDFVSNLNKTSTQLQRFGFSVSSYLSVPLGLAGGFAIKLSSDLEFTTQKMVALAGVSQEQANAWGSSIERIGVATNVSSNKIAETLYYVASAGIQAKEALEITEIAAKASAIGMGEASDMGRLLTYTINAYGSANISAKQAADSITVAIREGTAESGDMVRVIGNVIPIASQMGVKFGEVTGSIAAMTRTGFDAAKSATALRQIMVSLIHPTSEAEKTLESMGTSANELRKMITEKGLIQALIRIDQLTTQFGEEKIGQVFGNVRALTGDLSLVGKNLEANMEIIKKSKTEVGAFDYAFKIMTGTMQFKLGEVKKAGELALIGLGNALKGPLVSLLQGLVETLRNLTQWFKNLDNSTKEWILKIGALLVVLGPIALVGAALVKLFMALRVAVWAVGVAMEFTGSIMLLFPEAQVIVGLALLIETVRGLWKEYNKLSEVQQLVNDVNTQASQSIIQQRVQVEQLLRVASSDVVSKANKLAAIKELNDISPEYLKGINSETIATGEAITMVGRYIAALKNKAEAQAAQDKMVELEKRKLELQLNPSAAKDPNASFLDYIVHVEHSKEIQQMFANDELKSINNQETALQGVIDKLQYQSTVQQGIAKFTSLTSTEEKLGLEKITGEINTQYGLVKDIINMRSKDTSAEYQLSYEKEINGLLSKRAGFHALGGSLGLASDLFPDLKNYKGQGDILKEQEDRIKELSDLMQVASGKELDGYAREWVALDKAQKKRQELINMAKFQADLTPIKSLPGKVQGGLSPIDTTKALPLENMDKRLAQANLYANSFENISSVSTNLTKDLNFLAVKQQYLGTTFDSSTDTANALSSALDRYYELMSNTDAGTPQWTLLNDEITKTLKLLNAIPPKVEKLSKSTIDFAQHFKQGIESAAASLGDMLGKVFTGDLGTQSFFDGILSIVADFITQLGKSLVAAGVAAIAFQELLINPFAAVAAGIALIAMGSMIAARVNKGLDQTATGMANGGIVPDGYSNDSFPAMLTSGETVIPLNKMAEMFGKGQGNNTPQKVTFEIDGRKLVGVLENMSKLNRSF